MLLKLELVRRYLLVSPLLIALMVGPWYVWSGYRVVCVFDVCFKVKYTCLPDGMLWSGHYY